MKNNKILEKHEYSAILTKIQKIIISGQEEVKIQVNSILALTYWEIGKILENQKITENANYYNLILEDLETDLKIEKTTLSRCVKFFKTFPKKPEKTNLTWSHYKGLIALKDPKLRTALTQKSSQENWTITKLNNEIQKLKNAPNALKLLNNNQNSLKNPIKRPKTPNYLYKATIFDVVDGDTLILDIDLGFQVIKRQRIRLTQINAPEIKTENGKKSYEFLRNLCASLDNVVVRTRKVDIYGRFLGDIFFLNEEQKRGQDQIYFFKNGVFLSEFLFEKQMVDLA